jgi:peptidoglycan/xylan/chitin deacetylase (PgdA/CDA1 family)
MTDSHTSTSFSAERLRHSLPVLLYHDISSRSAKGSFRESVVDPSLFDEHLAAISQEGFVAEPVSRLFALERAEASQDSIFITFDDGYTTVVDEAQPLLERHGLVATVFVPTAFIGGRAAWLDRSGEGHRTIVSWQALRDLRACGIEIGGHGHEHLQLDIIAPRTLRSELRDGRALLQDGLGESVTSLAYPFGYHSRSVRRVARESGYELAFEVGDDLYTPSVARHFSIRRIVVTPNMSAEQVVAAARHGRSSPLVRRARLALGPALRLVQRRQRAFEYRNACSGVNEPDF